MKILDPAIAKMVRLEMQDFVTTFVAELMSKEFKAKALKVIREDVLNSLSKAGYDTTKPFILAIASRFDINIINHGDSIEYVLIHKFDDREIVTEYEISGGKKGKSYKIKSKDIAHFIDIGRSSYTIEPTQEHGMLAIPPKGEKYNPTNKENKIRYGSVTIPVLKASNYMESAKNKLDEYIKKVNADLIKDFKNRLDNIIGKLQTGI